MEERNYGQHAAGRRVGQMETARAMHGDSRPPSTRAAPSPKDARRAPPTEAERRRTGTNRVLAPPSLPPRIRPGQVIAIGGKSRRPFRRRTVRRLDAAALVPALAAPVAGLPRPAHSRPFAFVETPRRAAPSARAVQRGRHAARFRAALAKGCAVLYATRSTNEWPPSPPHRLQLVTRTNVLFYSAFNYFATYFRPRYTVAYFLVLTCQGKALKNTGRPIVCYTHNYSHVFLFFLIFFFSILFPLGLTLFYAV